MPSLAESEFLSSWGSERRGAMQWSSRHFSGRGLLRQPRFCRVEGLGTGERPQAPSTKWRSQEVCPSGHLRERGARRRPPTHNATILTHRAMICHTWILPTLVGRGREARLQLPGRERGRTRRNFSNFRDLEPAKSRKQLAELRHQVGRRHGDANAAAELEIQLSKVQ